MCNREYVDYQKTRHGIVSSKIKKEDVTEGERLYSSLWNVSNPRGWGSSERSVKSIVTKRDKK